jgi:hypothetical protein
MLMFLPIMIAIPASDGLAFPHLAYAAPNALFPLMAFFLLVRFEEHKPYILLYMAGKAVAITAILGWFVFSLQKVAPALAENPAKTLYTLGLTVILAALDGLSVLGCLALTLAPSEKPGKAPVPAELAPVRTELVPEELAPAGKAETLQWETDEAAGTEE